MTARLSRLALLLLALLLLVAAAPRAAEPDEREPQLLAELETRVESIERLFEIHEARLHADRPAFHAWLRDATPDTVPADVSCEKVKRCDRKNVCAIVCKRGSVEVSRWLERALELQRKLAFRRNFCRAQLPGTHNSAINLADGYGVEDHVFEGYLKYISWIKKGMHVHTNDQLFSLTDQLRMGVRFIELDVHWFDNDLRIAHCGGFSSKLLDGLIEAFNKIAKMLGSDIQWDSETIGCKPSLSSIPAKEQRSLKEALKEIADWLHAPEHKDEFLMIFFDDETDLKKWKKVATLLEYIKEYFPQDEILVPTDLKYGTTWPSFDELIRINKHIVFMSGSDYDMDGQEILFVKGEICGWTEPKLPLSPYPVCNFTDPEISPAGTDLTIFRPETSEIEYAFLNADGKVGKNHDLLDEKTLPDMVKCGANIPSPDNITPKRMEATVWALEPGHELVPKQCVALLRSSSTWQSVDCKRANMAPVCVNDANTLEWKLGGASIAESDAAAACTALALEYSVPATGYENQVVFKLLRDAPSSVEGVWIDAKSLAATIFVAPKGDENVTVELKQEDQPLALDIVQAIE